MFGQSFNSTNHYRKKYSIVDFIKNMVKISEFNIFINFGEDNISVFD